MEFGSFLNVFVVLCVFWTEFGRANGRFSEDLLSSILSQHSDLDYINKYLDLPEYSDTAERNGIYGKRDSSSGRVIIKKGVEPKTVKDMLHSIIEPQNIGESIANGAFRNAGESQNPEMDRILSKLKDNTISALNRDYPVASIPDEGKVHDDGPSDIEKDSDYEGSAGEYPASSKTTSSTFRSWGIDATSSKNFFENEDDFKIDTEENYQSYPDTEPTDISTFKNSANTDISTFKSSTYPDISTFESSTNPDISNFESSTNPDISTFRTSTKADTSTLKFSGNTDASTFTAFVNRTYGDFPSNTPDFKDFLPEHTSGDIGLFSPKGEFGDSGSKYDGNVYFSDVETQTENKTEEFGEAELKTAGIQEIPVTTREYTILVIGIVLVCFGILLIVAGLAFFCAQEKKKKRANSSNVEIRSKKLFEEA